MIVQRWLTALLSGLFCSVQCQNAMVAQPFRSVDARNLRDAVHTLSYEPHISEVILAPTRETVAHNRGFNDAIEGDGVAMLIGSSPDQELVFASIAPFHVESSITFDLWQLGFNSLEDNLISSATLKIYSLVGEPTEAAFNILIEKEGYEVDDLGWYIASSEVNTSSCVDSKPCWVDVEIADGINWAKNDQQNDLLEMSTGFTIRITPSHQLTKTRGAFASSNYKGGMFSPKLVINFFEVDDNGLANVATTRRGRPQDKLSNSRQSAQDNEVKKRNDKNWEKNEVKKKKKKKSGEKNQNVRPQSEPLQQNTNENRLHCGRDWEDAEKCTKRCNSQLDCPSGQFCYAGLPCDRSDRGEDDRTNTGGINDYGAQDESNSILTGACGSNFKAAATCKKQCTGNHDCPTGKYCWIGIRCPD